MISNITGVNKLDIPYGIFSNVNGNKLAKVSDNVIKGMKSYYTSSNKEDYRLKLNDLYDKIERITPIENQINNVIYTDNYLEKGTTINCSLSDFKQTWVEYRLMFNENKKKKGDFRMEENELPKIPIQKAENFFTTESYVLDNFDEIFDKLSRRVDGVNHYIDELKEKQTSLQTSKDNLEYEKKEIQKAREELEKEKLEFEKYKVEKEKELEQEKNRLKNNCDKFQNLVSKIDTRLTSIE